jgi:hypothetical protein
MAITEPAKAPQSDPLRPIPPPNPVANLGIRESSIPKYSLKLKETDSAQLNPFSK